MSATATMGNGGRRVPVASQPEKPGRFQTLHARLAIEWIMIALFAGTVIAILTFFAALVYWAWTA